MQDKIDFVITWVDGADPKWLADKAKYTGIDIKEDACRYRDWDLLRYWFRGVEKFAPWVNKIHFVTYGHLPSWLNVEHPKINIVKHQDFIPQKYLPTFNSHTIELNLHRISGLSEKFVYFNDDMFLTNSVVLSDFFVDGLPRDTFGFDALCFSKNSIAHINGNNIACINNKFSKKDFIQKHFRKIYSPNNGIKKVLKSILLTPFSYFTGFYYEHLPSSFLRASYYEAWNNFNIEMDETCSHKFRVISDVNQWLIKYLQFINGKFVNRNIGLGKCYHLNDSNIHLAIQNIEQQYNKVLCINDNENIANIKLYQKNIGAAFERVLVNKSNYEV